MSKYNLKVTVPVEIELDLEVNADTEEAAKQHIEMEAFWNSTNKMLKEAWEDYDWKGLPRDEVAPTVSDIKVSQFIKWEVVEEK